MTINEFLIETHNEDSDSLYKFYLEYIEGIYKNDYFPSFEQINFKAISRKFIEIIEKESYVKNEDREDFYLNIDNFLLNMNEFQRKNNSNKLIKFLYKNKLQLLNENSINIYSKIKETSVDLINNAKRFRDYNTTDFGLNDFYKPENIDKEKIKILLNEAIKLISEDDNITIKTKENLIKQILKIIDKLDRTYFSINSILGSISEIMIVLGGLGSFISGITPLFEATEKLKETTKIIQHNSININQKVINETFNIKNIKSLEYMNQKTFLIENKEENE